MRKPHTPQNRPRLAFVGSMVGRNPGHITQQGQILSDLFRRAQYEVISVSSFLNRYRRLIDIINTLIRKRHEIDILVLEIYGGPSFLVEDIASRISRHFGHRIVMWLHGGALPDFMSRFPQWTRRVLKRADMIVTPSGFLSRAVAEHGFQARVIPNVIDLSDYPYRHRQSVEPRLFWMRSFHPIWNPDMAVRVLARLKADYPDATLVMAGPDKGTQSETINLAESLGLGEQVRFTGFLDAEGKRREGMDADIFINTNRIDNAPVAVVEACAMGMPVVTTNVGGIPDLLTDGETALLVPDNDDEITARSIKRLIENDKLTSLLSKNGRRLAEGFSWEQVRPRWESLFAELMGHSKEESLSNHSASSIPRTYDSETQSAINLTEIC